MCHLGDRCALAHPPLVDVPGAFAHAAFTKAGRVGVFRRFIVQEFGPAAVVDVASVGMRVGFLVGGRRSDGRELGVQIGGILVLTGVGGNEGYVVGVNVSSGRLGGVILPKEFWRGQCVQTPVGLSHWQPAARHIAALTYSGQSSARTNS